jgi:hypothetical protein
VKISDYFSLEEFQTGDPIPEECIPVFKTLATQILDPLRKVANVPIGITSGYRSQHDNDEAHGQRTSEHMATTDWCAADCKLDIEDFSLRYNTTRALFDFARNASSLPYHQLILETGPDSVIIHISFNRLKLGIRSVLEGRENNASPYVAWPHVAYIPPQNIDLSAQDA